MIRQSFLAFGFGFLALTAACNTSDTVATGRVSQPIINGTDSTSAQDWVIQIQIEATGPGAPPGGVCTGSLIAPNLVLTARHCVSQGKGEAGFACTQDGVAPDDNGASSPGTDFAPTAFKFFTGPNNPAEGATPRAIGKKVIHDGATTLCAHDIALIILDTPINDITPVKMRLGAPAAVGELVTAIGWGVTTMESPTPAVRKQRTGVAVTKVGPAADDLPSGEFTVGEAICSGDSGGPAIAESTNEVLGVVSRGGNTLPDDPNDIAKGCVNGTNYYTALSSFKTLIEGAMTEAAGGAAVPTPDGGASSSGSTTTTPAAGADKEDSGCSTTGGGSSPWGSIGLALAGMLVLGARRRRR